MADDLFGFVGQGKREHVEIFEIEVSTPPTIKVDNREVVEAKFFSPARALEFDIFQPIRTVIEKRLAQSN